MDGKFQWDTDDSSKVSLSGVNEKRLKGYTPDLIDNRWITSKETTTTSLMYGDEILQKVFYNGQGYCIARYIYHISNVWLQILPPMLHINLMHSEHPSDIRWA